MVPSVGDVDVPVFQVVHVVVILRHVRGAVLKRDGSRLRHAVHGGEEPLRHVVSVQFLRQPPGSAASSDEVSDNTGGDRDAHQGGGGADDDASLDRVDAEVVEALAARPRGGAVDADGLLAVLQRDAELVERVWLQVANGVGPCQRLDDDRRVGRVAAPVLDLVAMLELDVPPRDGHRRGGHALHDHFRLRVLHVHARRARVMSEAVPRAARVHAVVQRLHVVDAQRTGRRDADVSDGGRRQRPVD